MRSGVVLVGSGCQVDCQEFLFSILFFFEDLNVLVVLLMDVSYSGSLMRTLEGF